MAEKFGFGGTSNKSRTMIMFGGAVIAVVIGLIVSKFTGKSNAPTEKQSTAINVPHNIDTTPGKDVSERYHNLQVQENQKRADDAQATGQSAIPTVVGEVKKYDFDLPNFEVEGPSDALKKLTNKTQNQKSPDEIAREAAALNGSSIPGKQATPEEIEKAREAALKAQQAQLLAQQQAQQALLNAQQGGRGGINGNGGGPNGGYGSGYGSGYGNGYGDGNGNGSGYGNGANGGGNGKGGSSDQTFQKMTAMSKTLFDTWNAFPKQTYTHGNYDDTVPIEGTVKDEKGVITRDPNASKKTKDVPHDTVKAGTIMFAVLDTSINTDEPGPILATIVDGPYKGGRLLGSVDKPTANADAVQLKFNRLSIANLKSSIGLDAVAIDPDTARTALASDADHHYVLRYGALFASSFLQGYGQAIGNQGSTTVSAADGSVTTQKPDLSPSQEIYTALGSVGQAWGTSIQDYVKRPTTITVDSGIGFGLLILSDLQVPKED